MEGKPRGKTRRIAVAAGMACVLALVGVGMALWHPWEAGAPGNGMAGGEMPVVNDDGSQSTAEDGGPAEEPEAWPGQAKGYVGPDGEGVVRREDYSSDEEYTDAAVATGEKQADVPHDLVEDPDGKTGYYEGTLGINFYRSYGELSAREIVADFGGVWVSDFFAWDTGLDYAMVSVYFPDVKGKDGLHALADEIMERPEVESVSLDTVFASSADLSSSPAEASLSDASAESQGDPESSSSIVGYPVNDPESSLQYMLTHSGFSSAWSTSRCEGRVQVAIFDSGIDADHEDLAANIVARYDAFHGGPLQGAGQDTSGHGTMVAGVVSAAANNAVGVAGCSYNAGLIPVRVNSQGQFVSWQAVEAAFNYVFFLSDKPEAINMSFCGTSGSFEDSGQQQRLQNLVNTARSTYGIVCVAAAGNDGDATVEYPAALNGVIGVGSIDSDYKPASSSNRNIYVDLCAPGVAILSTANPDFNGGSLYAIDSGTSFSAPQVAAAAALVRARHPSWKEEWVEQALTSTARDLGTKGRDDQYGAGALDAAAAVGWKPPDAYSPAYTSNDATNVWTQVYTMGRLASVADSLKTGTSKITRYDSNSATESAKSYEKAIRGNMLYIASQIDAGAVGRKTVAYLYAIDANGTGYFFTPTAEGLVAGDDTGADAETFATADGCYAANNGAVSYGYMDTLPFVTNTFDSGTAFSGGIVMKVEDIYKSSPACMVSHSATGALSGVDVIVYNSTVNTNLAGTQDGRNDSGVNNDYQGTPLSPYKVATWAAAHGFDAAAGSVIAGDDWGTGLQQTFADSAATTAGTAPLLCCPDDFSADKNARAAWAWAQVYPALYNNNPDATYCYWVDKVYHVNTTSVGTVAKYMTNQSDTVTYNNGVANQINSKIQTGLTWWNNTGKTKAPWSGYAYYNGSSRASYYSDDTASEEPTNAVGIFAPVLL